MSFEWRWRLLGLGFAGLIAFAFYSECRQSETQTADARTALRCVLGRPPVADVAARYREIHTAALRRGVAHPQGCAPYFVRAGRYHGNASSAPLQTGLRTTAALLEAGDEAAILDKLQLLVAELGYDRP